MCPIGTEGLSGPLRDPSGRKRPKIGRHGNKARNRCGLMHQSLSSKRETSQVSSGGVVSVDARFAFPFLVPCGFQGSAGNRRCSRVGYMATRVGLGAPTRALRFLGSRRSAPRPGADSVMWFAGEEEKAVSFKVGARSAWPLVRLIFGTSFNRQWCGHKGTEEVRMGRGGRQGTVEMPQLGGTYWTTSRARRHPRRIVS